MQYENELNGDSLLPLVYLGSFLQEGTQMSQCLISCSPQPAAHVQGLSCGQKLSGKKESASTGKNHVMIIV